MRKIPNCHPDKEYYAKDLCKNCYMKPWKEQFRRRRGIPKRVSRPDSWVVYSYFGSTGNVLYVGQGRYDRALEHKYVYKNSDWWPSATLLITMSCKDEWEAMEYEGKWGGHYHPEHNKQGNRSFRMRHTKRVV